MLKIRSADNNSIVRSCARQVAAVPARRVARLVLQSCASDKNDGVPLGVAAENLASSAYISKLSDK